MLDILKPYVLALVVLSEAGSASLDVLLACVTGPEGGNCRG